SVLPGSAHIGPSRGGQPRDYCERRPRRRPAGILRKRLPSRHAGPAVSPDYFELLLMKDSIRAPCEIRLQRLEPYFQGEDCNQDCYKPARIPDGESRPARMQFRLYRDRLPLGIEVPIHSRKPLKAAARRASPPERWRQQAGGMRGPNVRV